MMDAQANSRLPLQFLPVANAFANLQVIALHLISGYSIGFEPRAVCLQNARVRGI